MQDYSHSGSLTQPFTIALTVVEKIKRILPKLSPRQKILASFMIQHPEKVGFLSITELAKETGVSESTVTRFSDLLGYDGYSELGREVQESIQSELNTVGRFKLTHELSHSPTKSSRSAFERIIAHEIDNIVGMSKGINRADFYRCIDWIVRAEQVIIVGCQASASLALYFGYMLSKIFPSVRVVDGLGAATSGILNSLDSNSLVFLLSFPRHPLATTKIGEWAAGKNAKTIAITDGHTSPVAHISNVAFFVPVGIASFVDSYSAPIALINALITELSERNPDMTYSGLGRFDKYALEMKVFVKPAPSGKSSVKDQGTSRGKMNNDLTD